MKKFVGKRILKTGIAVSLALMLTGLLGFSSTFSGVVALIGLKETTKKSFRYAVTLIFGSLLSLMLGIAIHHFIGSSPFAFGLGTILAISILVPLKLTDGLILSVIVMYHVLENSPVGFEDFYTFSFREISVILIGLFTSLLVNILFPQKHDRYLEKRTEELYVMLSEHLGAIGEKVSNPNREEIKTSELVKTRKNIKKLIQKAEISAENMINDKEKEQYDLLIKKLKAMKKLIYMAEDMSNEANRLSSIQLHSPVIAKALLVLNRIQRLPEQTTVSSYKRLFNTLRNLHDDFKDSPLPESRDEFENRSALYHLYLSIIEYADQLFLLHDRCYFK